MTSTLAIMLAVVFAVMGFVRADETVWIGEHIVDQPLRFARKGLSVRPGAKVVFRGEGRITIENASFVADGAAFESDGILTNAFRISVSGGRLDMTRCRVLGVRSHEPSKGKGHYIFGAFWSQYGHGSRLDGNEFRDSSSVTYANASGVEVRDNLFLRSDKIGVYLFHVVNPVVVRNEFMKSVDEALCLNVVEGADVRGNRFTDCAAGIGTKSSRRCRFSGNSFFGGVTGMSFRWAGDENLCSANLFEDVKCAAFSALQPLGAANVFANNLVSRCGYGWSLGKQNSQRRIVICDNAIFCVGTGISLAEGEVDAPNNAFWKVRTPVSTKSEAKVSTPKMVAADPLFMDAVRGDYRLKPASPLLQAGVNGGNIGLYQ